MDLADMADKQIEDRLIIALAKSKNNYSSSTPGYSSHFEECGEPIPPERHRLLPGCATCVDCANLLEQANRIWGKDLGTW